MAIYRGPGGSGDAIADSANTAQVAETFATQAGVSAAAAASSAIDANAAKVAAEAAQTAAEAAQTAAETAETNAETAETNAETAQTAAEAARDAALAAQSAAETAETNAETAETNAETAQAAAEAAQLAAETAQTAAELAETNAETAETGALAAQAAAESARDSALAAYDNFDDRYLGAKTSDPTLDNDGNALVAGALYFNSVDEAMRVYTGSVWVDTYADGASFLAKANNLSDLPNVATARQNLDLEIGVDVQAYDATILKSADIGVTVQGYDATIVVDADIGVTVQAYDADTAKYDDPTANFSGTLQNGGHTVLTTASDYLDSADIGVTVQGYDADTVKTDVTQTFTAAQSFNSGNLKLNGSTSGSATLNAPAEAGTTTYSLPPTETILGYIDIPPVGTKTSSYTLATSDVGKYVQVGSGGSITIPDSTFSEGDAISIFNNTSGDITITCSITTAYIAGADTDKATMTLATRGLATILFISGTVCVVSGNVS